VADIISLSNVTASAALPAANQHNPKIESLWIIRFAVMSKRQWGYRWLI